MRRTTSRSKPVFHLLAVLSAVLCLTATSASAEKHQTTVSGQIGCWDGDVLRPLSGAQVVALDADGVFDDQISSGQTDKGGNFKLQGKAGDVGKSTSSLPDVFIKIRLTNGYVRLKDPASIQTISTRDSAVKNADSNVNLQLIKLGEKGVENRCSIWQKAVAAYDQYQTVIGTHPPYGTLTVIWSGAPFTFGYPWGARDTLYWSPGYEMGYQGVQHEFFHTVRHYMDGSFTHFVNDAARFDYAQGQHDECDERHNEGFAFNEGVANWWNRGYEVCEGDDHTDMGVEGNVGYGLTALEKCSRASRKEMVAVLALSPERIHSFSDYFSRFKQLFPSRLANCSTTTLRAFVS